MLINPALFHLHHLKETEDIPFWFQLAEERGDPSLELGCGTGRLMIPLKQAGHQIVGLDIDFHAINYLKNSVKKHQRHSKYLRCDI